MGGDPHCKGIFENFTSEEGKRKENERPKRPKWKEMKAQKAKMKGNESPKRPKWKEMKAPKGLKWKEMKPQKAKMKGNEGPKGHEGRCALASTDLRTLRFNLRFGIKFHSRATGSSAGNSWGAPSLVVRLATVPKMLRNAGPYGCGLSWNVRVTGQTFSERKFRVFRRVWKEMKVLKRAKIIFLPR